VDLKSLLGLALSGFPTNPQRVKAQLVKKFSRKEMNAGFSVVFRKIIQTLCSYRRLMTAMIHELSHKSTFTKSTRGGEFIFEYRWCLNKSDKTAVLLIRENQDL